MPQTSLAKETNNSVCPQIARLWKLIVHHYVPRTSNSKSHSDYSNFRYLNRFKSNFRIRVRYILCKIHIKYLYTRFRAIQDWYFYIDLKLRWLPRSAIVACPDRHVCYSHGVLEASCWRGATATCPSFIARSTDPYAAGIGRRRRRRRRPKLAWAGRKRTGAATDISSMTSLVCACGADGARKDRDKSVGRGTLFTCGWKRNQPSSTSLPLLLCLALCLCLSVCLSSHPPLVRSFLSSALVIYRKERWA